MLATTDPTRVRRLTLGVVVAALGLFAVFDLLGVPLVDVAAWILTAVLVELVELLFG
jgi:hypothetical protein